VANLIAEAGIERVLTLDLHAGQIQGFFDIPVDNLYAAPIFALDVEHHFRGRLDQVTVVSPDVGGVARARELAKRIGSALAIVDKRREAGRGGRDDRDRRCQGPTCIIVDDICDTAGTLCKAADLLMSEGAREVHAYITHGVLSGPAVERITGSVMKSLVITDSIEPTKAVRAAPNIRIVPTAPMFAQAILNIWNGTSVSSLFDTDTLVPIYEGTAKLMASSASGVMLPMARLIRPAPVAEHRLHIGQHQQHVGVQRCASKADVRSLSITASTPSILPSGHAPPGCRRRPRRSRRHRPRPAGGSGLMPRMRPAAATARRGATALASSTIDQRCSADRLPLRPCRPGRWVWWAGRKAGSLGRPRPASAAWRNRCPLGRAFISSCSIR
jgi:adenine/guanine phosphoribosyltransferase-like PRPP-binding protein